MMGHQAEPGQLFYKFSLGRHVPADHLLRQIDAVRCAACRRQQKTRLLDRVCMTAATPMAKRQTDFLSIGEALKRTLLSAFTQTASPIPGLSALRARVFFRVKQPRDGSANLPSVFNSLMIASIRSAATRETATSQMTHSEGCQNI